MDIPGDLVSGPPGIDLSNCVSRLKRIDSVERYRFLLEWARRSGILSDAETRHLSGEAKQRPEEAAEVAARGLDLSRAGRRLFSAAAGGRPAPGEALAVLNREVTLALPHLRLEGNRSGFCWSWDADDHLDRMLWAPARSMADLLVSEDLVRIKSCASDTCEWVFLDTSRNRKRRWCDMQTCGNREKARRHRARGSGKPGAEPGS